MPRHQRIRFDLRDLRRRRISVYIGVRPADLERLQLILNPFFQQVIDLNTDEMPAQNPALKHQLLLLMDEFTAVGRMPILAKSISFLGGYNVRPFIIVQGLSQLRSVYGADTAETIVTCCGAMIVFARKDQKNANEVSEMLGDTTVDAKSKSRSALEIMGASVTTSDHSRRLLKPQEVKEIGHGNKIIFIENMKPIFAQKISYWKDRAFTPRLLKPAHVDAIEVPGLPDPLNPAPPKQTRPHLHRAKEAPKERVR